MHPVRHKMTFVLLCLFFSCTLIAQSGKKKSGNGTRIQIGPVISFYKINTNHATDASQKTSGLFGFRQEWRLDRQYKSYFLIGIDYVLHGIRFNSYYFLPDTIQLYDKSFSYSYSLYIHELNLPLQYKYLFKREDNSLFSAYVIVGYHLRFLLPGNLKVEQEGQEIKTDQPEMKFKTPLLEDRFNSSISLGVGWQKNSLNSSKGSYFVELNARYGFSPYYFESSYSASSLYINATQICLLLGLKF
jgi:hypothetical protein